MAVVNDEINFLTGQQNATGGGMVVLFGIITCGIYTLYWNYKIGQTMENYHTQRGEPNGSLPILCLLLSLFGFGIVSLAILQNELNKYAAA